MSRLAASNLTIALYAVLVCQVQAQSGNPSSIEVSRAVLAAADSAGAEGLAAALAAAKIPAGFVLPTDDPKFDGTVGEVPLGPPVPMQDVIDRFLQRHPQYTLGRSAWAIVIRPRAETTCSSALARVLPNTSISDPVYVALWKLARLVNPAETPSVPPSVVCGGGCDPNDQQAHSIPVLLTLNGMTLQEALSQLVTQVPGVVWLMRDERHELAPPETVEHVCKLSYFDGRHHIQTSYVFARSTGNGQRE
jgi:hypothetical protein